MIKSMLSVVMLCLIGIMLTSCGTKGPLYIPEQRYPQVATPQVAPEAPASQPAN